MIVWNDRNITLFRSALYETISTVVMTNDCVIVADPSWLPHEIKEIRDYVDNIKGKRPLYLLFTHSDFDHIIGYKAFGDATVIASGAMYRKTKQEKDEIIEQIKAFDDEYYVTRNYEIVYPEVNIIIDGEQESINIGDTRLTFFQAPGHNHDGIFTFIEPVGVFIAGDYFSDIEFPYIEYSSYEYEKTILKLNRILEEFSIRLLITGHGNPTNDPFEMKKRLQDSLDYIYSMRKYVLEKNEAEIAQLIEGCKFPRNMKKYHQQNQELFIKELSKE